MVDEAKHFVSHVIPLLTSRNCNQQYIINMDQSPVYFNSPLKTLNVAGEQSINVRTSTGITIRSTCAATTSAAGDILRPFLVFKGKWDGRIAHDLQNSEKTGYPVNLFI